MKKNLLYITLLTLVVFTACQQDEDEAIMGRPEERMAEILHNYKQQLVNSPYGWKGFVFPELGGGYGFLFEFNQEGRVTMMADINEDCALKPFESSFRMAAVQRPSLFFDTYSYLHILSDPDSDTIGGNVGQGLLSDFEFAFESVNGDTIRLKGNQNGTPLMLIKASQEEAQAFKSGKVNTVLTNTSGYAKANPFVYIQSSDGKRLNTTFNLEERTFSLSYRQADTLSIASTPFGYTSRGIFLQKSMRYRNIQFREVFFDAAKNVWYIEASGTRIDVSSTPEPVLPLNLLLGVDFSVISIPAQKIEGWSQTFSTLRQNVSLTLLDNGIGLYEMELDFNTANKTLNFNVIIRSASNGRYFLAQYPYTYTKSADGVFKFSPYDEPNGNGEYIKPVMDALLYYFDTYRFRMEYYKTPAGGYVAEMKCVEKSAFAFTANFGSAWF
jgi:hypothetical protein